MQPFVHTISKETTISQKEAIEFKAKNEHKLPKHLVIEAGAGAGKTKVLTERVAHLVSSHQCSPSDIIVVTFSTGADAELQERLAKFGEQFSHMHVSTIDAFFAQLMDNLYPLWFDEMAQSLILPKSCVVPSVCPTLTLITDTQAQAHCELQLADFLGTLLTQAKISQHQTSEGILWDFILAGGFKKDSLGAQYSQEHARTALVKALLSERLIHLNAPELVTALGYIHPAQDSFSKDLKKLAQECFLTRLLAGTVTYADRAMFLYHAFCVPKDELEGTFFEAFSKLDIPISFEELIADEYQDTSESQHLILKSLVEKCKARMVVVGDPKQSIYGFRGAHVSVFSSLCKDPNWHVVELSQNFRSHPNLLEKINLLAETAMSFESSNLPDVYYNSPFFAAAKTSQVFFKPLQPKQFNYNDNGEPKFPRLQVLCGVNYVKHDSACAEKEDTPHTLKNEIFAEIVFYIQKWKEAFSHLTLDNFCLLCEENKEAEQLQEFLAHFKIESEIVKSKTKPASKFSQKVVFEAPKNLLKWLVSPLQASEAFHILSLSSFYPEKWLARFLIEWNSLSGGKKALTPLQAKELFLSTDFFEVKKGIENSKNKTQQPIFDNILSFFDSLILLSPTAQDFPFEAWQQARQNIQLSELDILVFDAFGSGFSKLKKELVQLDFESWEPAIDTRLAQSIEEIRTNGVLHGGKTNSSGTKEKVQIMTIHASKGLEWHTVGIVLKSKRARPAGNFSLVPIQNKTYFKWMPSDAQGYSLLQWQENTDFKENETSYLVQIGKQEATKYFIDAQLEQEVTFEKQRLYYTAFTRPMEYMFVAGPLPITASTKKSIFAELQSWQTKREKSKKPTFATLEEEFDTLPKYLFASILNVGQNEINSLISFENVEHLRVSGTSVSHTVDANTKGSNSEGANSEVERISQNKIIEEVAGSRKLEENQRVNFFEVKTQDAWNTQFAGAHKFAFDSNHKNNLDSRQNKKRASSAWMAAQLASKGTFFHTKQELFAEGFFADFFESAVEHRNEYEIWTKNTSSFEIERRVLDAWVKIEAQTALSLFEKYHFSLDEALRQKMGMKNEVYFVVDFKTGKHSEVHQKKITHYILALKNLKQAEIVCYGMLAYFHKETLKIEVFE